MPKIEISGDKDELKRISIFLSNNNINHILNDDLKGVITEDKIEEYWKDIIKPKVQ
ncbi:hypothetical protein [Flavobacterium sp. ASW18X]|uniref:hypothetical protein n=1 Tax=Flavobacterium sp. ASW18X TaxID=2572595 RepID=UPI00146DE168|nr:hypothetical protein [Flavobacterium sp. ASW18X]